MGVNLHVFDCKRSIFVDSELCIEGNHVVMVFCVAKDNYTFRLSHVGASESHSWTGGRVDLDKLDAILANCRWTHQGGNISFAWGNLCTCAL